MNTSKGEGQQDKLALSSFSVDVVQLVWQATAEIVKKLDKDLEAFGLRLDMTGEGFTHFFSLVYAWTLVSEGSKTRNLKPLLALCGEEDKWKTYFVSSLCDGPRQKSEMLGEQLAHSIRAHAGKMQAFFEKIRSQVQTAQSDFTAAKIQADLDEKFLLNPDPLASGAVVEYVTNQVAVIKDEFEQRWQKVYEPIRDEVLTEYKRHVRSFLNACKKRVKSLANFLEDNGVNTNLSETLFHSPGAEFLAQGRVPDEAAGRFFFDFMAGHDAKLEWFTTIDGQKVTCDKCMQTVFHEVPGGLELNPNVAKEVSCQTLGSSLENCQEWFLFPFSASLCKTGTSRKNLYQHITLWNFWKMRRTIISHPDH